MPGLHQIEVKNVRKVFGRHVALGGVSCAFTRGRVNLLVGPNGAGKSTLLAILSTLSRPTTGEVLYGDVSHREAETSMRGLIGQVDHAPMLYRQMSGRENLMFFARMYGVPDAEATVDAWLERVGMADHAGRAVRQLSRGMIQRVALASALLHDPAVLLLDEPFTGLDRQATDLLREQLAAAGEADKIVVLTTHELDAVDGICDQLLVLRGGRVVSQVQERGMAARLVKEHYHAAL